MKMIIYKLCIIMRKNVTRAPQFLVIERNEKKRLHLNYKLLNKDFKKLKQRVKIKLNVYTGSSN